MIIFGTSKLSPPRPTPVAVDLAQAGPNECSYECRSLGALARQLGRFLPRSRHDDTTLFANNSLVWAGIRGPMLPNRPHHGQHWRAHILLPDHLHSSAMEHTCFLLLSAYDYASLSSHTLPFSSTPVSTGGGPRDPGTKAGRSWLHARQSLVTVTLTSMVWRVESSSSLGSFGGPINNVDQRVQNKSDPHKSTYKSKLKLRLQYDYRACSAASGEDRTNCYAARHRGTARPGRPGTNIGVAVASKRTEIETQGGRHEDDEDTAVHTRDWGIFGGFEGSERLHEEVQARKKNVGADVLLTDSIYPDGPPAEFGSTSGLARPSGKAKAETRRVRPAGTQEFGRRSYKFLRREAKESAEPPWSVPNSFLLNIIQELFLKYHTGFVASSSDFWWHPVYQLSFGGCIASVMANRYRMQDGLSLFMSYSGQVQADAARLRSVRRGQKDWRNNDDRDDLDFWKQEKELFLKDLPQHDGLFEGLELNDDSDQEQDNEES
ncbi:hypothetical protein THAOC_01980 [Thalassiosira oceanica]|uniref:Uncharacterized protein n=1 Tax=Thalassiosira oceanica TaxID=159749 RepID=K0TFZ4_THAOC|nr:hypothetical protein THAOC_01980 [Thalassiosira oceanica]|eukprot:EJK76270.1 hypothetical protein THAOC_01980 [Thalassiosira oceanica]